MSTSSTTPYFPTTVEQNRARNEARARELGLPTNVEEATPCLWSASRHVMPHPVAAYRFAVKRLGVDYFATEKEAINAARKLRIDEIDHLQKEVNALDERYDHLEDEEIALEKRRINDPD